MKLETCVAQSASNNVLATTGDYSGALLMKRRRAVALLVRPDRPASDRRRRQHCLAHSLAHRFARGLARALLIAPIREPAERQAAEIGKRTKRQHHPWIGG